MELSAGCQFGKDNPYPPPLLPCSHTSTSTLGDGWKPLACTAQQSVKGRTVGGRTNLLNLQLFVVEQERNIPTHSTVILTDLSVGVNQW